MSTTPTAACLRVFCDLVAGGLAAIISGFGVWACATGDSRGFAQIWLITFTGLVLAGAVALLFSRSNRARQVAIGANTAAIAQVVATEIALVLCNSIQSDSLGFLSLLAAPPATLIALLVADHYLVRRGVVAGRSARPTPRRRFLRAAKLLGCGLMLMTNVALVAWLAGPLAMQLRSSMWRHAEATILDTTVIPRGDDGPAWVDVAYTFEVDGVRRMGHQTTAIPRGVWNYSDRHAARLAERFAPGSQPSVAYNPSDPTRSLLRPGLDGPTLVLLLACCYIICPLPFMLNSLLADEQAALAGRAPSERLGVYFTAAWAARQTAGVGVATFGLVSFLVAYVVLITTDGMPSFAWGLAAWGVVALVTVVACVWGYRQAWREVAGAPA